MRPILIIDDEKNIRAELSGLLGDEGYRTITAADPNEGIRLFLEESPDVILLDVRLPGRSGLDLLEEIRRKDAEVPVIVMSGQATIDAAVRATKLGAFDYLEKPLDPDRLLLTLRNSLETGRLRRKTRELSREVGRQLGIVGASPAMEKLRTEIERAARADARVLITGENGTGKEIVARALHDRSPRAAGPFVKVNCAAIPKELIESELFGHEKGSFTGAHSRKIGKIEAADGGALFLDEIGDMSLEAQAKLLRVLEEGEVERVGGNEPIRVDVRFLAATNKDLAKAIDAQTFREDLFYRLNVIPIRVPSLAEHREDVPALLNHFRNQFEQETGRAPRNFSKEAIEILVEWPWPGNVRELRNVVERLSIMAEGDTIEAEDVEAVLRESRTGFGQRSSPERAAQPRSPLSGIEGPAWGVPLAEILEKTERSAIRRALEEAQGKISEAAKILGMDRANLHRKMRRLGIGR
ncbi:MAG TPA: sigma-54 dependent transcriptional regulator, partial [bacterium]|nr:sigma-54 dependent transcriptional regulator [bacterium]